MLYFIKEPAFTLDEGWCWYKIGYTDDIDRRMDSYMSHCPDVILLGTKEGSMIDEQIIHKYLHYIYKDNCKFFRYEWYGFEDISYIYDVFNQDPSITEHFVWEHIDEIFPESTGKNWMSDLDDEVKNYLESKMVEEEKIKEIEEITKKDSSMTSSEKKEFRARIQEDYNKALLLSEEYKNSVDGKIRFSDEMKPDQKNLFRATYKDSDSLETCIHISFKRGKFYTEENILDILGIIYNKFKINKKPVLDDLTTEYTITRVWKDEPIIGHHCKKRLFYIKLA